MRSEITTRRFVARSCPVTTDVTAARRHVAEQHPTAFDKFRNRRTLILMMCSQPPDARQYGRKYRLERGVIDDQPMGTSIPHLPPNISAAPAVCPSVSLTI